jgi:hypothetical protein
MDFEEIVQAPTFRKLRRIIATQVLTDGITIPWDAYKGRNAVVTLGGNRTLLAPTNLRLADRLLLQVNQSILGGNNLTFAVQYKFPGGVPALRQGPSDSTFYEFVFDGSNLLCIDTKLAMPSFEYIQSTPATTWNVVHNLGYYPLVQIYDSSRRLTISDVQHVSVNQFTVIHPIATDGFAYYK